jgi:hypothetical protein
MDCFSGMNRDFRNQPHRIPESQWLMQPVQSYALQKSVAAPHPLRFPGPALPVAFMVGYAGTAALLRTTHFSMPTISMTTDAATRMRNHDATPMGALSNAVFMAGA